MSNTKKASALLADEPTTSATNGNDSKQLLSDIVISNLQSMTGNEVARQAPSIASRLLSQLKTERGNPVSLKSCLRTTGTCLNNPLFCKALGENLRSEIIGELCIIMTASTDNIVCLNALWCFSVQSFDSVTLDEQAATIVPQLSLVLKKLSTSINAHYESLKVIECLLRVAPIKMITLARHWWTIVFASIAHSDVKVRTLAKTVLDAGRAPLKENMEVLQRISKELKERVVKRILILFESDEVFVIELWISLVETLGNTLHVGTSLLNCLTEVVEKSGRSKSEASRVLTLKAWRRFIDVFAVDLDVLSNVKRLRFLLLPLEAILSSTSDGVENRIVTWWHLVVSLKSRLQMHFAMLVKPLLQHCFGQQNGTADTSPYVLKARRNLSEEALFLLVDFGTQILLLVFEQENPNDHTYGAEFHCELERLQSPALSNSVFLCNHSEWLLASLVSATVANVKSRRRLLLHVWRRAALFLRDIAQAASQRHLAIKLAACFLQAVRRVITSLIEVDLAMELLELITSTSCLPDSMLWSSVVSLDSQDLLQGTPCVFLVDLLIRGNILKDGCFQKVSAVFVKLLSFDDASPEVPVLDIIKSVVARLTTTIQHVENSNDAFTLWQHIAVQLNNYIDRTKEINQGDNSEHDFTCVLMTLLFPIEHLLPRHLNIVRDVYYGHNLHLYETFTTCAREVSDWNVNTFCAETLASMIPVVQRMKDDSNVENVLILYNIVTKHVEWKDVTIGLNAVQKPLKNQAVKTSESPPCNMTPLVHLLALLTNTIGKGQATHSSAANVIVFVEELTCLFTNVSDRSFIDAVILLAPAVTKILALPIPNERTFSNDALIQQVNSLWNMLVKRIPTYYAGSYDTEFLQHLASLFEVTFEHERKSLRDNCRRLWNKTFASTAEILNVPEKLSVHPFFTSTRRVSKKAIRSVQLKEKNNDVEADDSFCPNQDVVHSEVDEATMKKSDMCDATSPNEEYFCDLQENISRPTDNKGETEGVITTYGSSQSEDEHASVLQTEDTIDDVGKIRVDETCGWEDQLDCTELSQSESFLVDVPGAVIVLVANLLDTVEALNASAETNETGQSFAAKRTFDKLVESPMLPSSFTKNRRVRFSKPLVTDLRIITPPLHEPRCSSTHKRRKIAKQLDAITSRDHDIDQPIAGTKDSKDGPICAQLVNCTEDIDTILHELSSSARTTRGLSRILASHNIETIGHLSALTEAKISRLPFKPPKVTSTRKTLLAYLHHTRGEKDDTQKVEPEPDASVDMRCTAIESEQCVSNTSVAVLRDQSEQSTLATDVATATTQTEELSTNASFHEILAHADQNARRLVECGINHLTVDEISSIFQAFMNPVLAAWNSPAPAHR